MDEWGDNEDGGSDGGGSGDEDKPGIYGVATVW